MWERAPEAPEVTQLLTEVVDAARRTVHPDTHPAFHAEYDGFMPEGAPTPFFLWSRALTARYLRADAHAIVLNEARVSRPEALLIGALWEGAGPMTLEQVQTESGVAGDPERDLIELTEHGWVEEGPGGWTLTVEGRRTRERIEMRTNVLSAPPSTILSHRERHRLLQGLETLAV